MNRHRIIRYCNLLRVVIPRLQVQRALSDLEREGFVYSKRTTGRFVTEDKELIAQSRKQLSEEELEHFVSSMTHFGYEKEELPGVVGDYIKGV